MVIDDSLTGKEIAAIAYAQPSIHPRGFGLAIEVLIYIWFIICAVVVGLRVWVRTWREDSKQKWKINDYLAVLGFFPYIPASVFGIMAVRFGVGAPDSHLDSIKNGDFVQIRGKEYLMYYELTYYAASTITKYAIACTILHICVEKRYIYIMYSIMVLMALAATGCVIVLFVNCVPFSAYWNPELGQCKTANGFLILSYVGTAVQIVVDWSCAITPFFIVHSLQMKTRAKVSVVAILGLGILASVAALMRIVSYKYIDTAKYPKDHMVSEGRLLLWSLLESSLAITACSLPSLKKICISCMGRTLSRSGHGSGSRQLYRNESTPLPTLTPHGRTRTTVSGNAKWNRLQDDDASTRHIVKEVEFHVETDSSTSDKKISKAV